MGLVNHHGSKEDAQGNFPEVGMIQNSDKIIYTDMKQYMQNSYVNGKDHWPNTLSAALNFLANCKGGKVSCAAV